MESLRNVRVPLSLELGHTVLSLADVYALEPGDVIKLDETRESDISVRVGNHVRFKARPGTRDGRLAAELTQVMAEARMEEAEGGEGDGRSS